MLGLLAFAALAVAACDPLPISPATSPTPGPYPEGTPPPITGIPYVAGADVFRDVAVLADGSGVYVLHSSGMLYRGAIYDSVFTGKRAPSQTAPGGGFIDLGGLSRGIATREDGTGYVLDGWGALHGFAFNHGALPPRVTTGPYWKGWDIARGVAVLPDGSGGYVLDAWGGLQRFAVEGHPLPPKTSGGAYWPGWNIARGITLLPDGTGGYVLDGWGGMHRFAVGNNPLPPKVTSGPYWSGWDVARGVSHHPGGGGYVLDAFGGTHRFLTSWRPEEAPAGSYTNPELFTMGMDGSAHRYPHNAPDPMVLVDGGAYHALTTGVSFGGNVPHVQTERADLTHWGYASPVDALPALPSWAEGYPYSWAPDVVRFGSTWVMYFTARETSSGRQCIGVAIASTLDGPFSAVGVPLVCTTSPGGSGTGGAIDPSVFVDDDGTPYLLWKNDGNCCNQPTRIWSQRLVDGGLGLEGSPTAIVQRNQAWEDGNRNTLVNEPWKALVEAPVMVRDGSDYYVFYSGNWWESPYYATGWARCTSPIGPCTKPGPNPIVATDGPVAGPGSPDVFTDLSGQTWLAYHAWTASRVSETDGGARSLRIDALDFAGQQPVIDAPSSDPRLLAP